MLVVAAGLIVRRLIDPENLKQALEQQATAAIGQPVAVGKLSWEGFVRPRVVLDDVRVGAPAGITLARVEVAANLRGLLSRRVQDAGLAISGTRIQFPLPFRLGAADTATPAGGTPSPSTGESGFVVESVERIVFDDVELVAGHARLRLDAESSLTGDRLVVSRVRLASEHTAIEGSGEMSSLAARKGTFSLKADPLDLDEVLTLAGAFSQPASTETASAQAPMDIRVEIAAPRGRLLGIEATNIATTIAMTPRDVTLEPFSLGTFGGTLKGRLAIDTAQPRPSLQLNAAVAGMDVARIAAFAGSPNVATGALAGNITVRATGATADEIFKSATGNGALTVSDGTLPGLDLVQPIIVALGGRSGASLPSQGSRAFSSLRGTFALANGYLRTSDLKLESRDLDLGARGSLRVEGAVADMRADVTLSEALSAQAGRDLYRYTREGNRIVVPATVRGGLASPSVSVDVAALTKRAVRDALEDEVKKGLGRIFRP